MLTFSYAFLFSRHFRTSYEINFSPEPDKYEISCPDLTKRDPICSWIRLHNYLSNLTDIKVFASVWSPPHYMKNRAYQLLPKYEIPYLHYLKNVTSLIHSQFNISIENISPVNEPENVFAVWDHTNMLPAQLCRIIHDYNDPLISICPENSYFWVSRIYDTFTSTDSSFNCSHYCQIMATHAYALNVEKLLAYYDLVKYPNRGTTRPIWQTEVSSTYTDASKTEMGEALDLAENIINFVSITCIQRYYFWYSYTNGSSGESLIWGKDNGTTLYLPKKYFVYKLFISASNTLNNGPVKVNSCDFPASIPVAVSSAHPSSSPQDEITAGNDFACIQFGNVDRVLLNKESNSREILDKQECSSLCCTTETEDFICSSTETPGHTVIPARSVCHCILQVRETNSLAISTLTNSKYFCIYLSMLVFVLFKKLM